MDVLGIAHVQVAAPRGCEEAARAFYGRLIGLEELEKPAGLKGRGGVWFRCGRQQLHVGVEEDFAPARKAHPAFLVEDVGAVLARFAGEGVATHDDDAMEGVRRFYAADPWGNRLEFVSA